MTRRALVVGGYGLIGAEAVRALRDAGWSVVGAGRDLDAARRRFPELEWVRAELGRTSAADWAERLAGVDVVVNAAGALQDGWRDSMDAVHVAGLAALLEGCRSAGVRRIVHISAAGVAPGRRGGGTFNTAKAEGERLVAGSGLDWVILRPVLVFGPDAYGGTALLRGLSALPVAMPAFAPQALVQVVALSVVGQAVARASHPDTPGGRRLDLSGSAPMPLAQVLRGLRAWLGLRPAPVLAVPPLLAFLAARIGDGLGWLGWRSPIRSNTLAQASLGVTGDGGGEAALGLAPQTLEAILAATPSTLQERRFARLYFAKPALLMATSSFCAVTGVVGLIRLDTARQVLIDGGLAPPLAGALAAGGAAADLLIAAAIAFRPTSALGLRALSLLSIAYLFAGSLVRPDLWADPLGPFTKAVMVLILTVVTLGFMDDR